MTRRPLLNADVALIPSMAGELQTTQSATQDCSRVLAQFLDSYCSPCFGGLSKREIDLLAFRLLIQTKRVDLIRGQQAISRQLRIPISKVKSLIYDTQLRDDHCDESWFRDEVLKLLKTSHLDIDKAGACVKLAIDSPMLRKELESKIKELNGFADYSFNSEILKIDFEIFGLLIKDLANDVAVQSNLDSALRVAISNKDAKLLSWKDLVNEFLKGVANAAGGQSVDLSFGNLSGGASLLVKTAKKLLSSG